MGSVKILMGPKAKLPEIVQRSFLFSTQKFQTQKQTKNCPRIIFAFEHDFQNSKIKLKNDPLKSKNPKKASNHKMSENRPSPNMPTDSKTTFGIFKTQKSN